MRLFDNTLRDGGNVVGHGFSIELTQSIVGGLLRAGITDIEFGNCKGLGAYDLLNATNAPSDDAYLEAIQPYLEKGSIGMFMLAKCANEASVQKAADHKLAFLRVGENAGDGRKATKAVRMVKRAGLLCRYSMMKAYVSTPEELAEEARMLQDVGVDKITIMDSAGTMFPYEVTEYVYAMKRAVTIPVGFHGHSNLGLSQANALAAVEAGADEIDCGLLGMARSAGNCTTELAAATLMREGHLNNVDLYALLEYLDKELIPAMLPYGYHTAVSPTDLVLGLEGCHSNFLPMFQAVAEEVGVPLYPLIAKVCAQDRKSPSQDLIRETAIDLKSTT